jgi:hypothetical protein
MSRPLAARGRRVERGPREVAEAAERELDIAVKCVYY